MVLVSNGPLRTPFVAKKRSRKKVPTCKTFKSWQNPVFQSLSWPFSESARNLLHNAMVLVSNRLLWSPFVAKKRSRKKVPTCKTFKSWQNPVFQNLTWQFSESARNLLHNAGVLVSNRPLWSPFV